MKITFYLSVLLFTLFSCKEKNEGQSAKSNPESPIKQERILPQKKEDKFSLADFAKLVPIEIKKPKSKDVFKKYGIEFGGNCYACDLAVFKINKKNFDLAELCDEKNFRRYKDFSYEQKANSIIFTTPETTFVFTKVENLPIYQLKIEGKKPEFTNMRISEFYTTENLIPKFEEHDCGDFEG